MILAAGLIGTNALAGASSGPQKKRTAIKKQQKPTIEEQIQSLRQELQSQIDSLRANLLAKDAQLKQAQQTSAEARAAAARVQAALESQLAAVTTNTSAVNSLQAAVMDIKNVNATTIYSLTEKTADLKKAIENPSALHFKAVTLVPNGFVAAETVWRSKATGGDIATAFNAISYEHADAYSLSEFYGSARQSRIGLMVEGKPKWGCAARLL